MTNIEEKIQRQLELEQEGIQLGVDRYRKQMRETPVTEMPPGLALLHRVLDPLEKAIEEFKMPTRGGGRMHNVRRFLAEFDNTELAYITARRIINSIASPETVQRVAITLAETLLDHLEYKKFRAEAPKFLETVEANLKTSHERHRRTVILRAKRKIGIEDTHWPEDAKLRVGAKLIELFIAATGLVERVQNSKSQWILQPKPEVVKWIEDQHARCELLDPVYLPMIVKPVPWTSPYGGGYLTNSVHFRFKLVKTRNLKYLDELSERDMPLVYRALNALQETPWRINRRVYEVMKTVWDLDNGLGNLPRRDWEEPLPPKPWTTDEEFERLKQENPDVVKSWKRQAKQVYERRIRDKSKSRQTAYKLWLAEKFKDEPEIFFVWTLDWRGRMYPVQSFVNPQSDDVGKSLLEFAVGKPLGEGGFRWLKIHLANKFGFDKVSFDDRVQWVDDNHDEIMKSAEDPLVYHFWTEADDPWCFLAAAFEYRDAMLSGDPTAYVSHLPIAMDGSCNGLQNFSAMLRDEVGGKAVNLVPSDKPQDVYQEVCDVVSKMVEEEAAAGNEMAKVWVGKIDRALAKRNVMTVPYGASLFGMKEQLLEELSKRNSSEGRYLDDVDEDFGPAMYLAKKMYEAIGQVVIAARHAMDWLQEAAKVASSVEKPIRWVTPSGFLVHQQYLKQKNKDIRTVWGTARFKISLNFDTEKLDKRKQANGISPNFVHSMDASHLVLTVNKALDAGVSSFAMVHDSYGTHAADCDTLARLLREAFVEMYREDVLQSFADQLRAQLPPEAAEKIPPLPPKGNLDLEAVRDSLYFFA